MQSKNTIELNGNLYDAVTGKMLGKAQPAVAAATAVSVAPKKPAPQPAKAAAVSTPTGGANAKNIDGFFRSRSSTPAHAMHHKVTAQKTAVAAPAPPPLPAPKTPRTTPNHAKVHIPQASRRTGAPKTAVKLSTPVKVPADAARYSNQAKPHKPQSAITLMRAAVKRPSPSLKAQTTVHGALAHQKPSLIEVKRHVTAVNPDRLVRASTIEKSPLVAHHGQSINTITPAIAPLHVQPVPVKPEGDVPVAAPAPQPNNKPQDMFEHALANASNFKDVKQHRSNFRKHTRRHVANMAAGTLALLVIALFAFYQNFPGIQFKIASVRAGVATTMPNFSAAGFAYTGTATQNGKLAIGFSNSQGRYQLTQQNTNWSGNDMIQSISAVDASGRPNYTTVEAGGTQVYRFNNTGAVWVQNGTWYSISGTSALSNDQIKAIVENV